MKEYVKLGPSNTWTARRNPGRAWRGWPRACARPTRTACGHVASGVRRGKPMVGIVTRSGARPRTAPGAPCRGIREDVGASNAEARSRRRATGSGTADPRRARRGRGRRAGGGAARAASSRSRHRRARPGWPRTRRRAGRRRSLRRRLTLSVTLTNAPWYSIAWTVPLTALTSAPAGAVLERDAVAADRDRDRIARRRRAVPPSPPRSAGPGRSRGARCRLRGGHRRPLSTLWPPMKRAT